MRAKKMNNVSPLIPQGSNLEQQNQARASLKTKIFCALGVNVAVLLGLLLMPGCKRETPPPPVDNNMDDFYNTGVYTESNPPVTEVESNWQPELVGSNAAPALTPQTETGTTSFPVVEPTTLPTPPPLPEAGTSEYVVKKGDTFSSIAPKFHITTKALQEANPNVEPTKLQINQKLVIPVPAAVPSPTTAAAPAADGMRIHEVKSGDSLSALASTYHTTVKAIQAANGLKNSTIKVGQKLKIPASN
ncbi:MAG: LysM peptidoglycan-binding domain-containing protein [Verrucomicrobiae bacterium]|nr:LysM peptidoglycan-binding domain-containing protein [Verrucomicrobiae bacterium]